MHDIEKVSAEHRSELEAEAPDEEVLKIDEQRADKRAVYEDVTAWRRLPGALKLLLGGAVKCRYQCRYHTTRTTSYLSPFTFHLCALCQPKMSSWIAPLRPGLSTVIITVSYWAILIAPAMLPVGAPAQAQHSSIRSPPTFTILQSTTYLHNTPIRRLTVWFLFCAPKYTGCANSARKQSCGSGTHLGTLATSGHDGVTPVEVFALSNRLGPTRTDSRRLEATRGDSKVDSTLDSKCAPLVSNSTPRRRR